MLEFFRLSLLPCLFTCAVVANCYAETAAERSLRLLQEQYEQRYLSFAKEMEELAKFCEQQSFYADAERIRQRSQPESLSARELDALPEQVLPDIPPQLPPPELQWRTKLRKLETDYAQDLYRLSREALNRDHVSLSFALLREVAFYDPDNEFARKLLGFVRHGDDWTTPFEKANSLKGYIDHPQFGWLAQKHVERYEKGERLHNGKWISVEKEASIRSDFRYAWEVETEHFRIRTNHSLEKGVEIGRKLEAFHRFFIREYAAFFDSPQQMRAIFSSTSTARHRDARRYDVWYYKSQAEFISALQKREPRIAAINGLYLPFDRVAYFFHQPDSEERTLEETMYHEVTHQILSESSSQRIDNLCQFVNFWLVEAIACYMESYRVNSSGQVEIGNPNHIRVFLARHYAVNEDFYVPLKKFTALGKNEFQATPSPTISYYYSQGTGLAHFFMHYKDGIYRDAFIKHLSLAYSPIPRVRNAPPTLEELTEVSFETLDQQYLDYIKTLPDTPPPEIQIIRE